MVCAVAGDGSKKHPTTNPVRVERSRDTHPARNTSRPLDFARGERSFVGLCGIIRILRPLIPAVEGGRQRRFAVGGHFDAPFHPVGGNPRARLALISDAHITP